MYPDRAALALLVALAHADTQVPVMVLRPRGNNYPLEIPVTAEHITCLNSCRKPRKRTPARIARDKKNKQARRSRRRNRR